MSELAVVPLVEPSLGEAGRIRLGAKKPGKNRKGEDIERPSSLAQFRLTSLDRGLLERASGMYGGGGPRPWTDGDGRAAWELFTDSDTLDVVVLLTVRFFSQSYEVWQGGYCDRRGEPFPGAELMTRLHVLLPDLGGMGLWRLETGGWYAATELAGAAMLLAQARRAGATMVTARLRIEQRTRKLIENGAPAVRRFVVPALTPELGGLLDRMIAAGLTYSAEITSGAGGSLDAPQLAPPVQDSGDGGPGEEDPPELEAGTAISPAVPAAGGSGSVRNASSSAGPNAGPQQQAQRRGSEEAQGVASKPAAAVRAALPGQPGTGKAPAGQASPPGRPSGRGTSAAVRAPSPAARVEAGPPVSRAAGDLTARAPDDSVGSRAPAAGQPGVQPGGDGWFTAVVNELPGLVLEHDAALHLAGLPEFRDFFKGVEPGDRVAKLRRQAPSSAVAKTAGRELTKAFAKTTATPGTLEVGS